MRAYWRADTCAEASVDLETNSWQASIPRRNPGRDTLTSLLRDFELHWSMRFLLHESRATYDMTSHVDVLHLQSRQIARSKLTVDREIEHRQLASVGRHLQPRSNRPDFPELQRRLLAG